MRPATLASLALGLALAGAGLAACDLEPDVGKPLNSRCSNLDSDPAVDISFARDVRPLLARRCSACHFPGSENAIGFRLAGLDLSGYATLLKGGVRSAGTITVAGSPCDSIIIKKVSPGPPFGSRMPLNGPPFLAPSEIGLIHDWIAEGARDN
ncbi:MAG: hypothetical protein U1F43_13175 [Myxococcota bacterium]